MGKTVSLGQKFANPADQAQQHRSCKFAKIMNIMIENHRVQRPTNPKHCSTPATLLVKAFRSLRRTPPPLQQPPKTGNRPETVQAPGTHKNAVPTQNSCLPYMGSQFVCGPKMQDCLGRQEHNHTKTHTHTSAHISVACACLLTTSDLKRSLSHEGDIQVQTEKEC